MKRVEVYQQLEERMLRYADLIGVPSKDNDEALQILESRNGLLVDAVDSDMEKFTGNNIYVRESVAVKLRQVVAKLKKVDKNYSLEVVYGYRSLEIQKKLFNKFREKYRKRFSGIELLEVVHRNIAVPEVSGHPTGGAVDVQILKNGKPLDFGTKIWEFSKDSYSFSPFISRLASGNRKELRKIMLSEGFAPFDGEWWHFSYGDREWAVYYGKDATIYKQIDFKNLNKS